jgi:DNA repair protein RadC
MKYPDSTIKPQMVFDKHDLSDLQAKIDELDAEFKVREIQVTFNQDAYFFGQVSSSFDVYQFIKDRILSGIEVQEHFIALYLNQANKIIGYYHHSTGAINATLVDVEIVAAVALKTLAKSVVISHNHPSGNLSPSDADRSLTRRLKEALKLFDITLIDHLVITQNGYYSFAERQESSLRGPGEDANNLISELREEILLQLKKVTPANSPNLFEMLNTHGGYAQVEKMVIDRVLKSQLVPAALIPMIESEMQML